MTTVKAIFTKKYSIELIEDDNSYKIQYDSNHLDKPRTSELIYDFNLAASLFEIKLQELEGH